MLRNLAGLSSNGGDCSRPYLRGVNISESTHGNTFAFFSNVRLYLEVAPVSLLVPRESLRPSPSAGIDSSFRRGSRHQMGTCCMPPPGGAGEGLFFWDPHGDRTQNGPDTERRVCQFLPLHSDFTPALPSHLPIFPPTPPPQGRY